MHPLQTNNCSAVMRHRLCFTDSNHKEKHSHSAEGRGLGDPGSVSKVEAGIKMLRRLHR